MYCCVFHDLWKWSNIFSTRRKYSTDARENIQKRTSKATNRILNTSTALKCIGNIDSYLIRNSILVALTQKRNRSHPNKNTIQRNYKIQRVQQPVTFTGKNWPMKFFLHVAPANHISTLLEVFVFRSFTRLNDCQVSERIQVVRIMHPR